MNSARPVVDWGWLSLEGVWRFSTLLLAFCMLLSCGSGGGNGNDVPAPPQAKRTLLVTPALGGFGPGALVEVIGPAGEIIGTARTTADGKASPELGDFSGPFVVRVSGGAGVTFFNERSRNNEALPESFLLLAAVPGFSRCIPAPAVGVTPLTHAAAASLIVNPRSPTLNGLGSSESEVQARVAGANGRAAVSVGLDPKIVLTTPPRVLRSPSDNLDTSDSDAFMMGVVLTALALASPSNDLLAQVQTLAADFGSNNQFAQSAALLERTKSRIDDVNRSVVPTSLAALRVDLQPDPTLAKQESRGSVNIAIESQLKLTRSESATPPTSTLTPTGPVSSATSPCPAGAR